VKRGSQLLKAQDCRGLTYRVEALDGLGEVDSETVLAALVGGREEADQVEVQRSGLGTLRCIRNSSRTWRLYADNLRRDRRSE
jgi:hypothetical protein